MEITATELNRVFEMSIGFDLGLIVSFALLYGTACFIGWIRQKKISVIAVPPKETITEILEYNNISIEEFAERMNTSIAFAELLAYSIVPITKDVERYLTKINKIVTAQNEMNTLLKNYINQKD